jgi:aspartate/methionine/tyrosine aminotransferase
MFLKHALSEVAYSDQFHSYGRPGGELALNTVLAQKYESLFQRKLDPERNVIIGEGTTALLYYISLSLLNQGDETIAFEPYFQYLKFNSDMLQGTFRACQLIQPKSLKEKWHINFDEFDSLFNERTRILFLNSPHNPTGKIFTEEEYLRICETLKRYPQVTVISDEVYENYLFHDNEEKLSRFAALPGMWDRTISVYTTGKLFCATGWRIGYAFGPEHLISCVIAAARGATYSANRPAQLAFMKAFPEAEKVYNGEKSYYEFAQKFIKQNFEAMMEGLRKNKYLKPLYGEGGFFLVCDIQDIVEKIPKKYFYDNVIDSQPINMPFEKLDAPVYTPCYAFYRWLAEEFGVTVIPMDTFYHNIGDDIKRNKGKNFIRLSLCVLPEHVQAGLEKLNRLNDL